MVEYIVGPVLALLLGMKFTDYTSKKRAAEMEQQIKSLEARVEKVDGEILQKTMKIVLPIAQATDRLQTAIGVK